MQFDEKIVRELANLLKARFPYIYISTWEEERALELIRYTATEERFVRTKREVFVWSQTAGIVDEKGKSIGDTQNPQRAIEYIRRCGVHSVFVMKDFHVYFGVNNRPPEYGIIRSLRAVSYTHLKIAMEGYGYQVCAYETAEEALENIEAEKPDLAVFDLMLPGMDGLAAIKLIRKRSDSLKYIPIIVLTARDKEYDKVVGLDGGADRCV